LSEHLRATVLSPYPFHMMRQAGELHRAGVLERVVTAIPPGRAGVPRDLVRSRLRWSALRRAAGHVTARADRALNRAVIRDFDRWAGTQLGEPTVVNAHSGFATSTLSLAAARGVTVCCDRGSWHILEQRRVLDEEADRIGARREYFDPFLVDRELREYSLADRILVPSEPARQSFLRRGVDARRLVKAPYGADIPALPVPPEDRPAGGVICVGSVGLRKGQHHLVRAFRMVRAGGASLTLVGAVAPGWDERLRLDQPGIRATGHLSRARVIAELQRASVFVLASVEEGLAMVIPQAMSCGLPVIATEATGAAEVVTDGVEGIILPGAPDARRLAEAIDSLLSDPGRARAMGEAARRRAGSLGGWDRYGGHVVAAFRDSLAVPA
jgi:starch synthase